MKILYVITKGNWGGAQKYVFELATSLSRTTFECVVAHGWGDILPKKLTSEKRRSVFIPTLGRDVNAGKDVSSFFSLISLFRKEKPDVVHLNSSKIGGMGALAARLTGIKKIIFTVHGFAFNEERSFIQKTLIKCVSWITILLCTEVIFISKRELEIAALWPFTKHKLHLIYNGITMPSFLPREEAQKTLASYIKISPSLFQDKKIVCTIGELTNNKGYTYALEAFRTIPNSIYIIIGDGEQKEELLNLIRAYKLEENVFLTGRIPEASTMLQAADVFLLPSLKEGLPYVILEAGLAGIPVIATDVGGIPEIITHNVSGILIPSKDPQAIAHAVTTINDTYSKNLYEKILNEFNSADMVKKTTDIYL